MAKSKPSHKRSLVDELKMLDVLLAKAMDDALCDEPVTPTQTGVLLFLEQRQGEETPNRAIEEHFNVSNPAVSTMVKRLEAKGFVTTSINPEDKRHHCVSVTKKGVDAARAANRRVQKLDKTLFSGFTSEEQALARSFIKRMLGNLQN